MSKSKSKKGTEEKNKKNKSTSRTQERRQHARGKLLQVRKERAGGCSAKTKKQNNRVRHQGKQTSEYEVCWGWMKWLNERIKIHTYRCQHKYEHDDATYERMTLRAMLAWNANTSNLKNKTYIQPWSLLLLRTIHVCCTVNVPGKWRGRTSWGVYVSMVTN